jgi:hypothetical protein
VPLLIKPLRCPHCKEPIDKALLRRKGYLQDFLRSVPFPCPHCSNGLKYPENGDTFMSMGIFIAIILAPLFHFWDFQLMDTRYMFALGCAVIVVGSFIQKLNKASLPALDTSESSKNDGATNDKTDTQP